MKEGTPHSSLPHSTLITLTLITLHIHHTPLHIHHSHPTLITPHTHHTPTPHSSHPTFITLHSTFITHTHHSHSSLPPHTHHTPQAAHSKHTIVVYEVALSISRLVRKYHIQLNTLEWDHIYASMEAIYSHALLQSGDSEQNSLIHCIGDLVSNIENLYNASSPIGSSEHFFGFMELCKEALPVS